MGNADQITYAFELPDGRLWTFKVELLRAEAGPETRAEAPAWTRLEHERCSSCRLKPESHSHCPAALDAAPILAKFATLPSVCRLRVTAICPERICNVETDAQTALKALLGLVMATSGCPTLAQLRSQALFHLPFASLEETLYRTAGDYLIKQYFIARDGGNPDFELKGLDAFYRELGELNRSFFRRIRSAAEKDATLNAVVILHNISDLVGSSLEERLQPLHEAMARI